MREATILNDWTDLASGARVQHVLNDTAMEWDNRPSFYVAWPNGLQYGMQAGNTAEEAIGRLQ